MIARIKGKIIILIVYHLACATGWWASGFCAGSILMQSAIAVAVTVGLVFTGSLACNNTSIFDPYWSIAPPLMVTFYFTVLLRTSQVPPDLITGLWGNLLGAPRVAILFLLTMAYSIRLTRNFLRGWPGLSHEDWRYVDFRVKTGKAYWPFSLLALHIFPAIMVFGGTLSFWVAVVNGFRPMGLMDFAAILVTGYAIVLEASADRQMRKFLAENKETGKTMDKGLWALSRHPNYLGEILFWWGLYLFALSANPALWWVIIGPLAITLMFNIASIPMMEKRMLARRSDYADYMGRVGRMLPWKW